MKRNIKRNTLELQGADTAQKVFASHRDQIAKGSHLVATFNGVPTIGNDSARISKRIGAWSRHRVSLTVSDNLLHDARPMAERFQDKDENGQPLDAIGFASYRIARKVRDKFMRERLAWHSKELQSIGLAMIARATRKSGDMPYTKGTSFAGSLVTASTLEEMTLAAALVIKARANELPMGDVPFTPCLAYWVDKDTKNEVIAAAYRAARKALVRQLETVAVACDSCAIDELGKVTASNWPGPAESIGRKLHARAIRQDVYRNRQYLIAFWNEGKSQRWRASLIADLRILQMATRVVLGLPIQTGIGDKGRNVLAIRIHTMQTRARVGRLILREG